MMIAMTAIMEIYICPCSPEPKGLMTRNFVENIMVICRSKLAKIVKMAAKAATLEICYALFLLNN